MQELIGMSYTNLAVCLYIAGFLYYSFSLYDSIKRKPVEFAEKLGKINESGLMPEKVFLWLCATMITLSLVCWPMLLIMKAIRFFKGK